jgi:hypothetical protein
MVKMINFVMYLFSYLQLFANRRIPENGPVSPGLFYLSKDVNHAASFSVVAKYVL